MISLNQTQDFKKIIVTMINKSPVAGFQFDLENVTISGAPGGRAEAEGFTVSSSESRALGFSLTGATIEAGEGTLVELETTYVGKEICLSDIVISDPDGKAMKLVDSYKCYYPNTVQEISQMNYIAYPVTTAMIAQIAIATVAAEQLKRDKIRAEAIAANSPVILDLGNTDVSDGKLTVLLTNDVPVSEFQFDLTVGANIVSVSGGSSEEAKFSVTRIENKINGLSYTAVTIPAGEGTLIELEVTGQTGIYCLDNIVFLDSDGKELDNTNVFDCAIFNP
jgi:hypothetical protein